MQKALFLDRDGVINEEKEYLYKQEDVVFIEGIFDLCRHYIAQGYVIIVVTNQSGIARGYYTQEEFTKLSIWMQEVFATKSTPITAIYHCPHHPAITGDCSCRKPKPGMLLQAAKDHNIDLSRSVIVGDKERDIEAGINAGLQESYLLDETGSIRDSKATKIVQKLEEIWKR